MVERECGGQPLREKISRVGAAASLVFSVGAQAQKTTQDVPHENDSTHVQTLNVGELDDLQQMEGLHVIHVPGVTNRGQLPTMDYEVSAAGAESDGPLPLPTPAPTEVVLEPEVPTPISWDGACETNPDRYNWKPYALAAGFPENVVNGEMEHIIGVESKGDLCAVNMTSGATCWLQIHPGGEFYKDPVECMSEGYKKWDDGNGVMGDGLGGFQKHWRNHW